MASAAAVRVAGAETQRRGWQEQRSPGGGVRALEGPRPGGRGPMGGPPSLTFDSSGRLVFLGAKGSESLTRRPGRCRARRRSACRARPCRDRPAVPHNNEHHGQEPRRRNDCDDPSFVNLLVACGSSRGDHAGRATRQFTSPPQLTPVGGNPRRPTQGGNEASGPTFRGIQISPLCDRIYTTEQREKGRSVVLRMWAIESTRAKKCAGERTPSSHAIGRIEQDSATSPLTESFSPSFGDRSAQVTLLNASNLETIGSVRDVAKPPESFSPPPAMAFSPDSCSIAVGSQQGTISLVARSALAHPQLQMHLPGHPAR